MLLWQVYKEKTSLPLIYLAHQANHMGLGARRLVGEYVRRMFWICMAHVTSIRREPTSDVSNLYGA